MNRTYNMTNTDSKKTWAFRELVPVQGNLQLFFMRGEYPAIVDDQILINPEKTSLLYTDVDKNLVVDEGRLVLNHVMSGEIEADPIRYFCTGTGGYYGEADGTTDPMPPTGQDKDLSALIFTKEIDSLSHPNALATTFITLVGEEESNGNLTEFGLKTASGRLFCRRTVRPRFKDSNVFFIAKWTIQY